MGKQQALSYNPLQENQYTDYFQGQFIPLIVQRLSPHTGVFTYFANQSSADCA